MSDLTRFGIAQRDTYDTALAELMQGRKQTHWMWFIFPQLKVLAGLPRHGISGSRTWPRRVPTWPIPIWGPV